MQGGPVRPGAVQWEVGVFIGSVVRLGLRACVRWGVEGTEAPRHATAANGMGTGGNRMGSTNNLKRYPILLSVSFRCVRSFVLPNPAPITTQKFVHM